MAIRPIVPMTDIDRKVSSVTKPPALRRIAHSVADEVNTVSHCKTMEKEIDRPPVLIWNISFGSMRLSAHDTRWTILVWRSARSQLSRQKELHTDEYHLPSAICSKILQMRRSLPIALCFSNLRSEKSFRELDWGSRTCFAPITGERAERPWRV